MLSLLEISDYSPSLFFVLLHVLITLLTWLGAKRLQAKMLLKLTFSKKAKPITDAEAFTNRRILYESSLTEAVLIPCLFKNVSFELV